MAARKARDEEHAIKRLLKEIARTLRVVRPKTSVVIAFDGPAPLAKIITQRKRRSSEKVGAARLLACLPSCLHTRPPPTLDHLLWGSPSDCARMVPATIITQQELNTPINSLHLSPG